jgi:hypothetical protein
MDTPPERNPKQASHPGPAMKWDMDTLSGWIRQKQNPLITDDDLQILKEKKVNGEVFLSCAGDRSFFEGSCGLLPGPAVVLANLSRELAKEEGKLLSFMSCTPRRQQANHVTGNRQQAEDVEMSDAADMKSKLLSFTPCTPRRLQANNLTGSLKVDVKDIPKDKIRYKRPRPLVKSSGKNWVFQPHPDLYKTLAPNVLEHYTQYKNGNVDKTYAPIYFYRGGAGTGKSRHGSEFASSVQEAIRLHAELHTELHTDDDHCDHCDLCNLYNELSERLKKAFVFHVSFENGTSLTHEEKSDLMNAVGIRMLHQLLRGSRLNDLRRTYIADPDAVFQLVATAENVDWCNDFTGILVVDGIQKANKWDSDREDKQGVFYSFLSQIGDLSLMSRDPPETEEGEMRQSPFIMTCVTATYFGPAKQYLNDDIHRKRVYLPLNRLDVPTWKDSDDEVLNDDPGTRLLLDDVGGHARAIEVIAEELAKYRNGTGPNISELANTVLIRLKDRYSEVASMMGDDLIPVVQCILSRKPIRLQEFIPDSDKRWGHIIAKGLLWFEKIEKDPGSEYLFNPLGYLVAPYIWLWLFSRLLPAHNTDRLAHFLRQWDFNDYAYLLHRKTGIGYIGKVTWQTFEAFCCYFRILRSLWFGNGQMVLFKDLHSGCKLRDDHNTKVVNRQPDYGEAIHQYSTGATLDTDVVTKYAGILDTEKLLYVVTLHGQSASAGDHFFNIEAERRPSPLWKFLGGIVREVGQSKFVKKLSMETYKEERNKAAVPTDFFMLYTTAEITGDIALPDRSGLVDASNWKAYFGPFAGRAFIMSLSLVEEPE